MTHPDKVYEERVVKINELVDKKGSIDGFEFSNCHIMGPAVLVPSGCEFFGNSIGGQPDVVLWEVADARIKAGAISVANCAFRGCTFVNIGLAGPPPFVRKFREALGG